MRFTAYHSPEVLRTLGAERGGGGVARTAGAKDRRSFGLGIEVERGAVVPPKASDDGTCAAASLGEHFQEMAGWMRAEWRRADRRRRAFAASRGDGP